MASFFIKEIEYTHRPLDAFSQLTLCRKVAPLFVGLANGEPTIELLANLPMEDLDISLRTMLPFIQRKDSNTQTWSPIYVESVKRLSFSDITGPDMIEILFNVLLDYLPDFYHAVNHLVYGSNPPAAESKTAG